MDKDSFAKEHNEPLFVLLRSDDPEREKCKQQALNSVALFCQLYDEHKSNLGVYFAIKVPVSDGNDNTYLWYSFSGHENDIFNGEHFDLPPELSHHKKIKLHSDEIEDWMINDHGVLYGGFSIRYQRSLIPEIKLASFNNYNRSLEI